MTFRYFAFAAITIGCGGSAGSDANDISLDSGAGVSADGGAEDSGRVIEPPMTDSGSDPKPDAVGPADAGADAVTAADATVGDPDSMPTAPDLEASTGDSGADRYTHETDARVDSGVAPQDATTERAELDSATECQCSEGPCCDGCNFLVKGANCQDGTLIPGQTVIQSECIEPPPEEEDDRPICGSGESEHLGLMIDRKVLIEQCSGTSSACDGESFVLDPGPGYCWKTILDNDPNVGKEAYFCRSTGADSGAVKAKCGSCPPG